MLLEAAGPGLPDVIPRLRMLGIFTWFAGTAVLVAGTVLLVGAPVYAIAATVGAGSFTALILPFLKRVRPRPVDPVRTPALWVAAPGLLVVVVPQRIWLRDGLQL